MTSSKLVRHIEGDAKICIAHTKSDSHVHVNVIIAIIATSTNDSRDVIRLRFQGTLRTSPTGFEVNATVLQRPIASLTDAVPYTLL